MIGEALEKARLRPVRVIHNPASGGGKGEHTSLRAALERALGGTKPDWVLTEKPGDAREAARAWRRGLLVMAGGDGTVNEAVNGLGLAGFPEVVTLALAPSGTGNDLASTLAMPPGPGAAAEAIRARRVRVLDVARVRSAGVGERLFVNVATGGIGAQVSRAATEPGLKGRWGGLTYLRASLKLARAFEAREVRLTVDGTERRVRALNLAVGNCRYAGGGLLAVPGADPEDGLLDVVAVEDAGLRGLLPLAFKTLSGANYRRSRGVYAARAKELKVEAVPPGALEFNADGELIGHGPAEFAVIPRALRVIVGPAYAAEPGRSPRGAWDGRVTEEGERGAERVAGSPPLRRKHFSEGGS